MHVNGILLSCTTIQIIYAYCFLEYPRNKLSENKMAAVTFMHISLGCCTNIEMNVPLGRTSVSRVLCNDMCTKFKFGLTDILTITIKELESHS